MNAAVQVVTRLSAVLAILICASVNADVSVYQFGPVLLILGDNGDDGIQIGQFANEDIFLRGLDCNEVPTLINGKDEDYVAYSGVRTIFVNTRGGNDCVAATNDIVLLLQCLEFDLTDPRARRFRVDEELAEKIVISGELEIITGSGDDDVGIAEFETGGAMEVFSGSGNDDVGFCDVCVNTNLLVITSGDSDCVSMTSSVSISEFEFERNFVKYNATFNSGTGADHVKIDNLCVDVGNLNIITSSGRDTVAIGTCVGGENAEVGDEEEACVIVGTNLYLNTGPDSDFCVFRNTDVGLNLLCYFGRGFDELYMEDIKVRFSTIINAGAGDGNIISVRCLCTGFDLVVHLSSDTDLCGIERAIKVGNNFVVFLGSGDDQILVSDVDVGGTASFFADRGSDVVYIDDLDANLINIFMGLDNDELTLLRCDAGRLFALAGSGYDCLSVLDNVFSLETILGFDDICD